MLLIISSPISSFLRLAFADFKVDYLLARGMCVPAASCLFSAGESGMVRRAAFDLPGEPGPSVRRPPEPSTWARRTALKQPAQHARGLPGACFPRLQTMGARPYLSAGHRVWG